MIFCFGMIKTGTSSLREALRQLGYAIHASPFNPRLRRRFACGDYSLGTEGGTVFSDLLIATHWRQLHHTHAGARVILTVRDAASWLWSVQTWLGNVPEKSTAFSLINEYCGGDLSEDGLLTMYLRHNRFVSEACNPIVMDICGSESNELWSQLIGGLQHRFPHERPAK